MDGFKNSTKTQYSKGGPSGLKGAACASSAMAKFKRGGPVESTSARPVKVGPTDEERVAQRAMRSSAIEQAGDGIITRMPRSPQPKPRALPPQARDPREPVIQSPLSRRLTTLPSQRGEFTVKR